LLAHRRCSLLSFSLHSSVVYMNVETCHLSVYNISLPLLMLVACMLIRNCSWIALLIRSSFQWNHRVACLTKTTLRRWGVAVGFALLLL
jgi:hypothetical protein